MYNRTELLHSLYQRTEALLNKAVSTWQNLPDAVLSNKPAPDAWSAAQCLHHLNVYARYYNPALEKALEHATKAASDTYRPGWLGGYFYHLMLPRPDGSLQKKMPSPANAVPPPAPDARAAVAEFIDHLEKRLELMRRAYTRDLNGPRIPITISRMVRLKPGDVFLFVAAHEERHVLQLEKAVEVPFSKTAQGSGFGAGA